MWHGSNPGDHKERRGTGMGRQRSRTRERVREEQQKEAAAAAAAAAASAASAAEAGSSRPHHRFDMQRSPAGKPKRERSRSPPYPRPGYKRHGVVAAEGGIRDADGMAIKWHEPFPAGSCKGGTENCSICMLVDAHRRKLFPTQLLDAAAFAVAAACNSSRWAVWSGLW